jgi:hypothetical protein
VSCCDEEEPTARRLIHALSAPWVDPAKPVTLSVHTCGSGRDVVELLITGITTTARGQSLDYEFIYPDDESRES